MEKCSLLKNDVDLQEHQKRVIQKLETSPGLLLFHGLGSGKTLSSIAATQGMDTDVVTPASLRENYKKEVAKFSKGHKPEVMSFEKFIKTPLDSSKREKALVVDEAHLAGREGTSRSAILQEAGELYAKKLLLTGTPIRNHPSEIAALINTVAGSKVLPTSKGVFSAKFIKEDRVDPGFFQRLLGTTPGVTYSIKNKGEFAKAVDGRVDYYQPEKDAYPEAINEVIEVPMSPAQKDMYDFVMGEASSSLSRKIRNGLPPNKQEAKQLNTFLNAARQVSNATAAFGDGQHTPKVTEAVSSLLKMYKKDPNFKAAVYSNFLDSGVKEYAKALDSKNIPYAVFDGSLKDSERKAVVDSYNEGKIKALLLSGAGSQGLDLKGTKLVQILEPHWNASRTDQVEGRAIRYKSHDHLPEEERKVVVQRYLSTLPPTFIDKLLMNKKNSDKSVDQYLMMLAADKQKLNDQFLDVLKQVGSN